MAACQAILQAQLAELDSDAALAFSAGRLAAAEKQLKALIELQQRAYGPQHEDTLNSQHRLANIMTLQRRYVEADAILREVLQVKQQSPKIGMEHESTLATVSALGMSLVTQKRFKQAEPMLRKVYALDVRVLGPRHESTLNMQAMLARCLAGDKQYDKAERLFRDALQAWQTWELTPGQPMERPGVVGAAMQDLALFLLMDAHKYVEAESLLRAAVKYTRHNLGEQHILTSSVMALPALSLAALGKLAAAEVMYRLAVQGYRAAFGWEHSETLKYTVEYVACLGEQQKWAVAEVLMRDTLSHVQQAFGEDHPTVLEWMRDLADCLLHQGQRSKRNEATALLQRARKLACNRQQ